MAAASSPNPNQFAVLALVGIGAYWLLTRRATAAQPVMTPAGLQAAPSTGGLGSLISGITGLFRNPNTTPAALNVANAVGTANAISDANYAGADWSALSSSAIDGTAVNPTNSSPYDAFVNTGTATGADLGLFY